MMEMETNNGQSLEDKDQSYDAKNDGDGVVGVVGRGDGGGGGGVEDGGANSARIAAGGTTTTTQRRRRKSSDEIPRRPSQSNGSNEKTDDDPNFKQSPSLSSPPSPLFSLSSSFNRCVDQNPRTCAVLCRVILPLCFLMTLALIGGIILASLEAPVEYNSNDSILTNRWLAETYDLDEYIDAFTNLPFVCLVYALNKTNVIDNITLYDIFISKPDFISSIDDGRINLTSVLNGNTSNSTGDGDGTGTGSGSAVDEEDVATESLLNALSLYLVTLENNTDECVADADELVEFVQTFDNITDDALALQDLTFDWIRCENSSDIGSLRDRVIQAQNQADLYEQVWNQNRIEWFQLLYGLLLGETATDDEDLASIVNEMSSSSGTMMNLTSEDAKTIAFTISPFFATGSSACTINDGGSTWFFFTVMTTIGYGNQSPVTQAGRITVAVFGFISIIAFAAILTNTGAVVDALYEDFIERCKLKKYLGRPIYAAIIFALLTVGWILFAAYCAYLFWDLRLPDDESIPALGESMWFAYISILTVGLGDFFLQPEYMWISDAVGFSFLFLLGFVLLSTFLTQMSDIFRGPDYVSPRERLQQRMEKTRHTACSCITSNNENVPEDFDGNSAYDDMDPIETVSTKSHHLKSDAPSLSSNERELWLLSSLSLTAKDEHKSTSQIQLEYKYLQELLGLKEDEMNRRHQETQNGDRL